MRDQISSRKPSCRCRHSHRTPRPDEARVHLGTTAGIERACPLEVETWQPTYKCHCFHLRFRMSLKFAQLHHRTLHPPNTHATLNNPKTSESPLTHLDSRPKPRRCATTRSSCALSRLGSFERLLKRNVDPQRRAPPVQRYGHHNRKAIWNSVATRSSCVQFGLARSTKLALWIGTEP